MHRRLKKLKLPMKQGGLRTARVELRRGRSRTQWKNFKKKANIRSIDLDVLATIENLEKIGMGLKDGRMAAAGQK